MSRIDDLTKQAAELEGLHPDTTSGDYDHERLDEWDNDCRMIVKSGTGRDPQECAIWRLDSMHFADKFKGIFKQAPGNCDAFYGKPTLDFGIDLDFEKMLSKAPRDFVEDYFEAVIEGYLFTIYPGRDNLENAIALAEAYMGQKLSSELKNNLRMRRRHV
jgi:hypothetical protein